MHFPLVVFCVYMCHALSRTCSLFYNFAFNILQVGRTETIDNNLNPVFSQKFLVEYFFEEKQNLKFEV